MRGTTDKSAKKVFTPSRTHHTPHTLHFSPEDSKLRTRWRRPLSALRLVPRNTVFFECPLLGAPQRGLRQGQRVEKHKNVADIFPRRVTNFMAEMRSRGIGMRFTKYVGHFFSETTFRFWRRIFSFCWNEQQCQLDRHDVTDHEIHITIDA